MIVYLAGNLQVEMFERLADRAGANHFLCSFADEGARQTARHFCQQPHRRIFVDSGAFSAWTNAKDIDLGEYITFCKEIMALAKCPVVFAALDVIPGKKGDELTPAQIQRACDKGWDNYMTMKQEGVSPCLMTYHQFEHVRQLKRIADDSDYFAISPRKRDVDTAAKAQWVEQVFRYIQGSGKVTKKIHGLGVCSFDLMKRVPFFSVDNTAWLASVKGRDWHQFNPQRRSGGKLWTRQEFEARAEKDGIPDNTATRFFDAIYGVYGEDPDQQANSGSYFLETHAMMEEVEKQFYVTEFWRSRGVVWEGQEDIKPKYFPVRLTEADKS